MNILISLIGELMQMQILDIPFEDLYSMFLEKLQQIIGFLMYILAKLEMLIEMEMFIFMILICSVDIVLDGV
jgi:hypothetical protein